MAEMRHIFVEVAWAHDGRAHETHLQLPIGATLADALVAAAEQTGTSWAEDREVGIWGKLQSRTTPLSDGDRVELYQPLKVDPKKARRERFAKQGARGAGLFAKRRAQAKQGY